MRQHEKNALQVALFLQKHPKVESVYFPGLETHVNHQIAAKQMTGFGGLVSFNIKGGLEAANKFFKGLKIFSLADSLGGVESLANYSTIMTHGGMPTELKKKTGITENLIRLSIGIEYVDDLINDLDGALNNTK
jgi:cystathionine gamma-lyase